MDTKNVLMAIVLSTIVLVFWATFFEPPPPPIEKQIAENQITKDEETSSPSIEKTELSKKMLLFFISLLERVKNQFFFINFHNKRL